MNDIEKLLHGILDTTNSFWNARYIGRACYPGYHQVSLLADDERQQAGLLCLREL